MLNESRGTSSVLLAMFGLTPRLVAILIAGSGYDLQQFHADRVLAGETFDGPGTDHRR